MLKKEIQVEKKERLLLQLDGWFEEDFYVNSLKIPADYIKGFHYFLIEDTDFVRDPESQKQNPNEVSD